MKKIAVVLTALAFCACAKVEKEQPVNYITLNFNASVETVKTALADNDVVWRAGDQVAIFAGTEKVVATIPQDGATATLSVVVPDVDTYYAVYPASEANTFDAATSTFHVTVPTVQQATDGSFADEANVSVAKTTKAELSFTFKNVLSAVKFQVAEDVKQVAFYGNAVESLAGTAVVNGAEENFVALPEDGAASKYVIVRGPFKAGTTYYASILANQFTKGITVHVAKGNGVLGILSTNALAVQNSHVATLGNLCTTVESKGGWKDISAVTSYKVKEADMWLNKDYADSLFARKDLSLNTGAYHLMTNDETVNLLEINVPSTRKFRLVVNRAVPEIRYYDQANDLKPLNLSFYANGKEDQAFVTVGDVTKLFAYGSISWDGANIGLDQVSNVDPQIIVKKNQYAYGKGKTINFPVCRAGEFTKLGHEGLKVSNSYTFGPTNHDWVNNSRKFGDYVGVPVVCGEWFPCQGGAANDKSGGPRGTYFYCVTDKETFASQGFIGAVVDMRNCRILLLKDQIK